MEKRNTFNNIIFDYDEARPCYPTNLYSDIIEFSNITLNDNVLEIGSGTGQATEYFITMGYPILGLEIGDQQVLFLKEKYEKYINFRPVCVPFEDFRSKNDKFGLVFSATAFHWIKSEIAYPKAYDLLKLGGILAVFWHMSPIMKHESEMFSRIREIYRKYAPELDTSKNSEEIQEIHELRNKQFQTNNLFSKPFYKNYQWIDMYSTEKYIKLLNTYSSFQVLEVNKRQKVLESVAEYINSRKGLIEVPQEVRLYMGRKV